MTRRERQALRLLIDEARRELVQRERADAPVVDRLPYWRAYYQRNRDQIRARKNARYASNQAHNAAEPQKGGRL